MRRHAITALSGRARAPLALRGASTASCIALLAVALAGAAAPPHAGETGTYRNPVLFADYSDPDVTRRGDEYFMVASSFSAVPGLPILRSRDLVSWTIVGHAAERLPSPLFDRPQHGKGLWAPSIRFHDGLFWIYVGDPDRGILLTRAADPRGPWEPLALVKEGKGLIDPCPLWDDDGSVYLVHAWAKSRAGFNGILTVNRLSADGRKVVDEGVTVFEGKQRHPTIEGPKFYKRGGEYYIFAPAGGVSAGWQTALRSKAVLGPYEDRIVLEKGGTDVNGPHQGAFVETPQGESWFLHFQERGAYGRIVHLQPMQWKDGWPVIGSDPDGDGRGEPVAAFRRPRVAAPQPAEAPQTSDEFDAAPLGLQWQWQANPQATWWSLDARPGALRLLPVARPEGRSLWDAGNLLLQKLPAESFTATTALTLAPAREGESAGLVVMGRDYAHVGLVRGPGGLRVEVASCLDADEGGVPRVAASAAVEGASVRLRASIGAGAVARFSYSSDGRTFVALGEPFVARAGLWVGAKIGLFAAAAHGTEPRGWADFDWFRIEG